MLINFCEPVLKPVISSSGVSHEGHSVQNLISSDKSDRERGFLGYGSPPTTITIQFLSYINIKHIVIGPQVRSKKSLGFEISARCSKFNATGAGDTEGHFEKVGFVVLRDSDKGVIFYKNNYKPKINIEPEFLHVSLYRNYAVGNTNCITIKIFKAVSSVPAIGRIEVWGEPGRSCSRSFKNHIYRLWHQNKSFGSNLSNLGLVTDKTWNLSKRDVEMTLFQSRSTPRFDSSTELGLSQLELPEEFLDSITCNLMTLPFILPSGKVVDIQTLEKHKDYEAMYGRPASDPFTGIRFSPDSLPIPDHDLKRRIDRFLVENSHRSEFKNIPRTTGPMSKHFLAHTKTILSPSPKIEHAAKEKMSKFPEHVIGRLKKKELKSSLVLTASYQNTKCSSVSLSKSQSKRKIEELEKGTDFLHKKSKGQTGPIISNIVLPLSQNVQNKTHEQLLNDSLDLALKSALAGLPSFTKFDPERAKLDKTEPPQCCRCQAHELLFIFPCKTLVCRSCLPSVLGVTCCGNCGSIHQSNDVVRYHYH